MNRTSVRSNNHLSDAWKWKDSRVCDLGLRFRESGLASYRGHLMRELQQRGLMKFRPTVYFGDEWFTPDRTIAISVPFYLATPSLIDFFLDSKCVELEGTTHDQFMRLMRHECGHAFDHAYKISYRRDFRLLFGDPAKPYNPDAQISDYDCESYVRNLNPGYAQTHPYEDFAETFAVWLESDEKKLRAFAAKPRIAAKFLYINKLAKLLGNAATYCTNRTPLNPTWRIKKTLIQVATASD
jgi:hypothetical protein